MLHELEAHVSRSDDLSHEKTEFMQSSRVFDISNPVHDKTTTDKSTPFANIVAGCAEEIEQSYHFLNQSYCTLLPIPHTCFSKSENGFYYLNIRRFLLN